MKGTPYERKDSTGNKTKTTAEQQRATLVRATIELRRTAKTCRDGGLPDLSTLIDNFALMYGADVED